MSEAVRQVPEKEVISSKPQTFTAKAYAAYSATSPLAPFSFARRSPRPQDVQIEILYCGVCHSDLHQVRNEWQSVMPTTYPVVPGHEIVGRVVKTGSAVKKFKEGDIAAVGCLVDSCRVCANCVVDENYVLRVGNRLNPAGAAPLLCAGITTYSPMRHWKVGKGQKVGIVGLGGLGHMGVKFAHAFGAHVVLFTTSPSKTADALRLGADEVVISKNNAEMEKHSNSFNFILDAVSAEHDLNAYLRLLKLDGTMTLVGAPEKPSPISSFNLIMKRRSLAGSAIGGIRETQEMLDFCAENGITSDIELIPVQQINQAYDRLLKGDVKYRFVIDMATLK